MQMCQYNQYQLMVAILIRMNNTVTFSLMFDYMF